MKKRNGGVREDYILKFVNYDDTSKLKNKQKKKLLVGGEDMNNFLTGSNRGSLERTVIELQMKTMLEKISTGHIQDVEGASCGGKLTPVLRTLPG